mmetsp:Transcript_7153/g.10641  ORF Transcript_7153/g.10641 Transcript_7153/m.10641 type:complete len:157 (+) Transcript_7153:149-619(+)
MFRRPAISLSKLLPRRGAPPKLRKDKKSFPVIHASQRPPYPSDIDFTSLGLKFPPVHESSMITEAGWSKKPDTSPDYPFTVDRTIVGNSLPVYTDIKNGRTKVVTLLRRCGGDVHVLRDEMSKVCDGKEVRICTGRLEVDGNYCLRLKKWLISLGL